MLFILLAGAVSAADSNDTFTLANATDDGPGEVIVDENVTGYENVTEDENGTGEQNVTEIQNATFYKVSKANYLTKESFNVKLLDVNGTGIFNKTVYFTINGKIIPVKTNAKGLAKLPLKYKKGQYTVKYTFNDTDYNPIKGSKKILLLTKPVSTIKGSNMKANAGVKKTYKVTLKADGLPLAGRKVTFKVNKKTYTRKTDSKGVATFTVYLAKGKYTISYEYAGEQNIKKSKSSSKLTIKLLKNPYKTKYRKVIIDADGGFTKQFLNEVASRLRKAGWSVVVKGIGPDQHSKNYWLARNCVYMPIYNGMCAGTIKEMAYSNYGGVIKRNGGVLAPAWYTEDWTKPDGMGPYRYDISKMKFLKRAWDDNFSPSSFKGLSNPAQYMTKNGIKYCVGDTTYMIVEQFLYGGWVAHH